MDELFGVDILESVDETYCLTTIDGSLEPVILTRRTFRVTGVVPGSIASGKLKVNDVIREVDGVRISSALLKRLKHQKCTILRILRT